MGNDPSQSVSDINDAAAIARKQQLKELQDISSNYLEHLEQIIDSRNTVNDPRIIISILKHNLKTAREQISKISTPHFTNDSNHNSLSHSNKHKISSDSDSTESRFSYDWCNASIEHIHFDQCKLGKIDDIQIASSTYNPVIMVTLSQDSKCRIWKLRMKSNHYEILNRDKKANVVHPYEVDGLQEIYNSYSNEIKEDEYIADITDTNHTSKHRKHKKDDIDKYIEKELRFELCHEIHLLSSASALCIAIHCDGNLIAVGGMNKNVTLFDVSALTKQHISVPQFHHKKSQSGFSTLSIAKKRISDTYRKRGGTNPIGYKSNIESSFEIESKDVLLTELCFWTQYISCIQFMNDDQHIMVGSADGTVTVCNYKSMDRIWCWKSDYDIICMDYLYLEPQNNRLSSFTRNKASAIHRKNEGNENKKNNKWSFKKNKKIDMTFDGVPIVENDFDDDSTDSSESDHLSDNIMSVNTMYQRVYDYNYVSKRHIMILIGTASDTNHNVFMDELTLSIDEYDKLDIVSAKKNHLAQFKEKDLLSDSVTFSYNLEQKKCETVKFNPNGKYFAIGGKAGKYEIYDRNSLVMIHQRYTKDEEDLIIRERRKDIKRMNGNKENEYFITCLTWINEDTVAVGNNKGAFIYISTILNEHKMRNFVLKEWMNNVCNDDKAITLKVNGIIQEIDQFIGYDVIDNVIETNFGERTSCLTSHPYFTMKPIYNTTYCMPSTPNTSVYNQHRKEGLCVSGSWSAGFQGCVLKG